MATHTTTALGTYTTGETVDTFKKLFDGLISVGLTQTTDTGQLNLTTAPAAVFNAANHNYGYTVHKLDDASFATYPIYIRIDYTNQNNANTTIMMPRFQMTVGTSTNGAGVIGGNVENTTILYANSNADRVTRNIVISFSDKGLYFIVNENAGNNFEQYFGVSRLVNQLGNVVDNSYVKEHNSKTGQFSNFIYNTFVVQTSKTTVNIGQFANCWYPKVNTWSPNAQVSGSDIPVYPHTIPVPAYRTATQSILTLNNVNLGDVFTVNRLGKTYTYRGVSNNIAPSQTWLRAAMIWE